MHFSFIILAIIIAAALLFILILFLVKQNKPESFQIANRNSNDAMGKGMAVGIAIGMGTGIALGTALDNIGMGIALGTGIGISLGLAFGNAFKKKEEEELRLKSNSKIYRHSQNTKLPVLIGIISVLIGLLVLGLIFFMKTN